MNIHSPICEREWETGIPRNGREREFPVSPAKDYGRLADWANKPRVDQTTICPPVLPQPTLLLVLCKCLNQPLLSTLLLDHLWCAKRWRGRVGKFAGFWGCTMTEMSQQIQRQYGKTVDNAVQGTWRHRKRNGQLRSKFTPRI